MVHVYVAVQAYDKRVLKYQGECKREDMDKMFPGVHYDCFNKYMGDRITTNQPHYLVTGTSGNFNQDVTEEVFTENSLPPVIGYWVGGVIGNEFVHWGQDGNTIYPFQDQHEAALQAEHIQKDPNRVLAEVSADTVYMITLFSNGQMKTEIMP